MSSFAVPLQSEACDAAMLPQQQTKLGRKLDQLEQLIEQHVTALYGLSEEDLAVIRDVPIPS